MIRRRDKPDGLPFRVYERRGVRVYSIGQKAVDGTWLFRLSCPVSDKSEIERLRKQAISQSTAIYHKPIQATAELIAEWFDWQESLPANNLSRRADSTLRENRRESVNLIKAFGHLEPAQITKVDGYQYLDACVQANRPAKGNKEIALLRLILEYGIRTGRLEVNGLDGIRKNKVAANRRYVSDGEIELAVEMGRRHGGSRHIVAMAIKTAWLCVRRSVEVRGIGLDALTDAGIVWRDGKSKTKASVLIEWTPELLATIDEARAIKRNHVAGSIYLFGNMRGQRYTKGGWKAVLNDLMDACEAEAKVRGLAFQRFSLQDCRPKGVSDKLDAGHTDTQSATGHSSLAMIGQVYDRRNVKKATAVK